MLLLEEAISLRPKIIIEAFYAGNDLFEAFTKVYTNNSQLTYLKTRNNNKSTEIEQLQQISIKLLQKRIPMWQQTPIEVSFTP